MNEGGSNGNYFHLFSKRSECMLVNSIQEKFC